MPKLVDAKIFAVRPLTTNSDRVDIRRYLEKASGHKTVFFALVVGASSLLGLGGIGLAVFTSSWIPVSLAAFAVMLLIIFVINPKRELDASVEWTAGARTDVIAFSDTGIDLRGTQNGKVWTLALLWPEVDVVRRLGDGVVISCDHGDVQFLVSRRWCDRADFDKLLSLLQLRLGVKAEI